MRRIRAALSVTLLALVGCASHVHDPIAQPMSLAGERAAVSLEQHYGGASRGSPELDELRLDAAAIARHCPHMEIDLDLAILNSKSINAFSLPPGRIYITRGLLDLVPERSLRQAIIAHELAHLIAGDSFKPRPEGDEAAKREVDADRRAIELLASVGVQPIAMRTLLERIAPHQRQGVRNARLHAIHDIAANCAPHP